MRLTYSNPQVVTRVRSVSLVRPETGGVTDEVDLKLADGRVVDIVESGTEADAGALDGSGLFAMAGLIDAHVHALGPLVEDVPATTDLPWVFRQQKRNLAAYLRAGVTTIRDMCAPLNSIRWASRRAARFEIESPRILYAGPMLTVPEGYPHYLRPLPKLLELAIGPLRVDLTSPAEARRRVAWLARAGAQCIKVGYQSEDYSQRRAPLPTMGPSLMRAVADQARRHGLGLALHVVYLEDLRAVIDLPFDSLEHTPIDGLVDDQAVARLARRALPVTSTLSAYAPADQAEELARLLLDEPWRFEVKPRETVRRIADGLRRGESISPLFGEWMVETGATFMRQNVRRLHEAGLPVVFGSDSGTGAGLPGNPIWEMRQLRRAGLSNREVLMTATINAAKAVGRPDLGRLSIGSTADVLLLRANPLEDIEALTEVAAVIRDGRLMVTPGASGGRW